MSVLGCRPTCGDDVRRPLTAAVATRAKRYPSWRKTASPCDWQGLIAGLVPALPPRAAPQTLVAQSGACMTAITASMVEPVSGNRQGRDEGKRREHRRRDPEIGDSATRCQRHSWLTAIRADTGGSSTLTGFLQPLGFV